MARRHGRAYPWTSKSDLLIMWVGFFGRTGLSPFRDNPFTTRASCYILGRRTARLTTARASTGSPFRERREFP